MTILEHHQLRAHNTFGISAFCQRFIEFGSESDAIEVARLLADTAMPFIIIGQGSNLLLTKDFPGIVVRSVIKGKTIEQMPDGSALLHCGSGESWDEVVAWTIDRGYTSLTNLSLIPGDVGASAVQNIGAYGAEASQYIRQIHAVDLNTLETVVIDAADCHYAYRQSQFKQEWKNRFLITKVTYRILRDEPLHLDYGNIREELRRRQIDNPTAQTLREVIIAIRRQKLPDPTELGNAGSFFMNPIIERQTFEQLLKTYPDMPHYAVGTERVKLPAAWLIDQCGWKGRSLGRAGVHRHQPLVLVNQGGATGEEILNLCHAIQQDVLKRFGIVLNPEVNII